MSDYIILQKNNEGTKAKKDREKEVVGAKEVAETALKEEEEAKAAMKAKKEAAKAAMKAKGEAAKAAMKAKEEAETALKAEEVAEATLKAKEAVLAAKKELGAATKGVNAAKERLKVAEKKLNSIQVAEKLVDKLQKTYDGLRFNQSKFPLFSFMRDDTDEKKMPKLYLWQGEADAIAFYNRQYIIVDFKTVGNISEYQQNAVDLCGKHLHQCLIDAQLLKLHMNLDYLPPILIVVIDRVTGFQIYPPLFGKYPSECEEKLKNFKWSKKEFSQKPPLRLRDDGKLFIGNTVSPVDTGKKLTEIFKSEATAKDLLDALGYGSLEITRVKKEKT